MTHYLRNNNNDTIIEVDTSSNDLRATVNVLVYSKKLLDFYMEHGPVTASRFACRIDDLSEIRGMWFERVESERVVTMEEFVEQMMLSTAKSFDCHYVID